MAEYVKFRLTAAKVGVSMAFFAMLAGLAEKTRAAPAHVKAKPAAFDAFLKLDGIKGESKNAFLKIEGKFSKIETALAKLEVKLSRSYFTTKKLDSTFLKIADASKKYAKIDFANANFLKIADAKEFLKITDANAKFLKFDATAADSNKLGGIPASSFVQGGGAIASGALTISGNSPSQTLLSVPGTNGEIIVVCTPNPGGGSVNVIFHNATTFTLSALIDQGASDKPIQLPPGDTLLALITAPGQFHLQSFPATGFNHVLTLTVSGEQLGNAFSVVGQMLNGGG
jgi:hypothetical protein